MNTHTDTHDPRTHTDRRDPEQTELRRMIFASALMAERLRALGTPSDIELADAWGRQLESWREREGV